MKKKVILIGGVFALIFLVVAVFGFVFLGSIVKAGVVSVGPVVTKTPVKLGAATLSIFSGAGKLSDFELGNPEGFNSEFATKVGSVALAVSPGSIFADKVVIRSINVQAPEITFEQGLGGNNLSKILANVQAMAGTGTNKTAQASGPGKKLQVDEFVVSGGRITVAATMLGGKGATLPLPEIRLGQMGQGPEGITPAELIEKVMGSVTSATVKAVAEGAGELAKQGLDIGKQTGGAAAESAKKIGTGLGGLLKKKE
jgi:uncharacterized protein involved in outer membrane biogenesis